MNNTTMDGGLDTFGLSVPGANDIRQMALSRIVPFQQLDVPLSPQLTLSNVFPIAGNFLTFSFDEVASLQAAWPYPTQRLNVVLLAADGVPGARLPVWHGTTIEAPFFGIAFEGNWNAGGGAILRVLYGTNVKLQPATRQVQVNPGNTALRSVITGTALQSVSTFRSTTNLTAGGTESILTTGQNTNGIHVQYATLRGEGAPHSLQFGTVAPTTAYDGNTLLMAEGAIATTTTPRTIPTGQRLDRISASAQTVGYCSIVYSLTVTGWAFP